MSALPADSGAITSSDPTNAAPSESYPTAKELVESKTNTQEAAQSDRLTAVMILGAIAIFWSLM